MANRTLIPALRAHVGDWTYYVCVMKYAQVAREVRFAYELGGNTDLNKLIQRGLSARTVEIKDYLLRAHHRFLGALIVAAWGGEPEYVPVKMESEDGLIEGLDDQFGVLIFDGSQQYFALDGQHRLKAIKDALAKNPALGSEEISVLLVKHTDDAEGRERTRRLFTNINRNARKTTKSEDIALDEDDGYAIIARRLVTEHEFFSTTGRVLVFTDIGHDGEVKLATGNVSKSHKSAFTTLVTLYEMLRTLGYDLDPSMGKENGRPDNDVLDSSYDILQSRLTKLMNACGDIRKKVESTANARDLRAPAKNESAGHPFMRPVIQRMLADVVGKLMLTGEVSEKDLYARIAQLPWKLESAPWCAIARANGTQVKMYSQRDHVELLQDLLFAHLYPKSRASIKRALQDYRALFNEKYPVSEDKLAENITDR